MRNTAGQRPSDPRTGGASRLVMAELDAVT